MLNFLYSIFLKLYLDFWVLGGFKTRLDWSEPWIRLLRVGLYPKNKCSCLDSKDRSVWCVVTLNPFSGLNFQVGTWRVDVGVKLTSNHYKFLCLLCLFLFTYSLCYLLAFLLLCLNLFLLNINPLHSISLAHYFSALIF